MPPNFMALSTQLDLATDGTFGEQISLQPFKKDYMTEPVPDGSRTVQAGVGQIMNRGTMIKQAGNAEFLSRRAQADLLLSVRMIYLTGIKQGDRVVMLDRDNKTYEISFIEDGVNTRQVIHLIKIKEDE